MATKSSYERYKQNKTREKNKVKRVKKHLKFHPNNLKMLEHLNELLATLRTTNR